MSVANLISKELITKQIKITASGCWEWQGNKKDHKNYGFITIQRKGYYTHRLAAHLWNNFDLTSKLCVCHKCDNPPCCNPAHLFIGTQKDNIRDMTAKGRHADFRGQRHAKAYLTEDDILLIREMYIAEWGPTEIGLVFGISPPHANNIIKQRIWKCV